MLYLNASGSVSFSRSSVRIPSISVFVALKRYKYVVVPILCFLRILQLAPPLFSSFANQFRDMDPIIEQFLADYGMNPHASFATTYDRKQTLLKLNPSPCTVIESALTATAQADPNDNWNVSAILCGDGEFHLSLQSYFGSSSLDGVASGFWPLIWDSLNISWALKCIIILLIGLIVP